MSATKGVLTIFLVAGTFVGWIAANVMFWEWATPDNPWRPLFGLTSALIGPLLLAALTIDFLNRKC